MGERLRDQAEDNHHPQICGLQLILLHSGLGNGGPKVVQNFAIYAFLQTEELMLIGYRIPLFYWLSDSLASNVN